jgi:hypothetical protein
VFICGLQVPSSAPAHAATGVVLDYEVRYGPLQILALRNTSRLQGGRYEARSEMRTVGMIGMLFPWTAGSSTNGRGQGAALLPELHRAEGAFRGVTRSVAIEYGGDGAVSVQVAPSAESDERDPVPPELQQGTIDPLTAGLAAVASGCAGTLRVFDGRRRYDMALSDQGEAEVPESSHTIYQGRARRCRATITPLAGFWRRNQAQEDYRPSLLDAWIAAPKPDVMPVPVYLELTAPRGTVGIYLSAATVLGEEQEKSSATDEHR